LDTHIEQSREGRRYRADSGNELGENERPHPVSAEEVLRAAHARIRLERDAAEHVQHMPAPMATQVVPDEIAHEAGGHSLAYSHAEVHLPGSSQGPNGY